MSDGYGGDPYEQYYRPRGGAQGGPGPANGPGGPGYAGGGAGYPPASGSGRTRPAQRPLPEDLRLHPSDGFVRSRRAKRQRVLIFTSGILSLVVLLASGGAWAFTDYVSGQLQKIDAGINGHSGPSGAMNILLVGADRRQGLSRKEQAELHLGHDAGQRTDTIMLMHVSKNHDSVSVVSLPRDSYVHIPGHGMAKINSAYSPQAFKDGGAKLTVKTVEENTGVQIDHYVEINFIGVLKVVDALGGVEICTPTALHDMSSGINLTAGKHILNGKQALEYVRTRHTYANQDLGRIGAQQKFMSALLNKAISTGTLTNPARLTRFLNTSLAAVRADSGFSTSSIRELAASMSGVSTDSVAFTTVPIANANYTAPGVGSSVLWDKPLAQQLFGKIKNDQPIAAQQKTKSKKSGGQKPKNNLTVPPNRIQLQIFNGAGTAGLGAKARHDLKAVGFQVPSIAKNWPSQGRRTTVVQYGPGRDDSARTVAAALPGSQMKMVPGMPSVRVILGSSYSGAKQVQVSAQDSGSPDQPKTATENLCK